MNSEKKNKEKKEIPASKKTKRINERKMAEEKNKKLLLDRSKFK